MPFVLTNERSRLQRFLASLVRVKALVLIVAGLVGVLKKVFLFSCANVRRKAWTPTRSG